MNYDRAVLSDLACTLVADQLPYDARRDVRTESHLADDLGFDSLDVIELVMVCEEEFDIEIEDADSEKFFTVQDLIDYLVRELIEPAA